MGFGAVAGTYERARPEYPEEAVAWLADRLGISPGRTVVDLAAGTGKLTRMLVRTGARVVAVEPLDEMRAELRRAEPEAEALAGKAEAMPLADGAADAVTVAQAFHWFDPDRALAEIARVLRPGGGLGLIWNSRDSRDPLQAAIDRLLEEQGIPLSHRRRHRAGVDEVLAASRFFDPPELRRFEYRQVFDIDGLVERIASISFVALLDDRDRTAVLDRVRALGEERGAPIVFPYVTLVYVSSLRRR